MALEQNILKHLTGDYSLVIHSVNGNKRPQASVIPRPIEKTQHTEKGYKEYASAVLSRATSGELVTSAEIITIYDGVDEREAIVIAGKYNDHIRHVAQRGLILQAILLGNRRTSKPYF